MSSIAFIHLSDIHFRRTSGTSGDIDSDLRAALLADIKHNGVENLDNIKGILVGGDIAFAGQKDEYVHAKVFLKELTYQLNIDEKDIYCVPGNHDVDQSIVTQSRSLYMAQKSIEDARTLDEADKLLGEYLVDKSNPNLLFVAIEEYNNFAAAYSCNIDSQSLVWKKTFELSEDMKLKIVGMNSCIISNKDDHLHQGEIRKMIVGQGQIESYEENTVVVALCHHPTEFWKFIESIKGKLNKRFDIQLYGHKHEQSIENDVESLVISAGATQPTRGDGWMPSYNWITFECIRVDGDRYIRVKVYPRVLSKDRSRFISDSKSCLSEKLYFQYELNIDEKRRKNLCDKVRLIGTPTEKHTVINSAQELSREIVYSFFDLSYIQQLEILSRFDLIREEYSGKRHIEVIELILEDIKQKNLLNEFNQAITNKKRLFKEV